MNKQRISWIDLAKCIGIVAIVLGHCSSGSLTCICFSFNSILFFVLAGMTFCRKKEETDHYLSFNHERTLKTFLYQTFQTLVVPYLFWGLVSILIYSVVGRLTTNTLNMSQSHFGIGKNLIFLLYGNSDTGYFEWNRPLWFLPCLIMVELLWFLILKISQTSLKKKWFMWIVYGGIMLLSVANMIFISYSGMKFVLPFELETAISMMFFFGIGLFLRNEILIDFVHKYILSGKKLLPYFFLICGISLTIFLSLVNGLTDTRSDYYSNVFIYILNALCACFFILLITRIIDHSSWMEYIGQRTLAILVMHKFPIMFLRVFFPFAEEKISEGNIPFEILICAFTIGCCLIAEKIISLIVPEVFGKVRTQHIRTIFSRKNP